MHSVRASANMTAKIAILRGLVCSLWLASFLTTYDIASAQWTALYPRPTGERGYAFEVVDSSTFWLAAGGSGSLFHTTDAGKSWDIHHTGVEAFFQDIQFLDHSTGFAVGGYGRFSSGSQDTSYAVKTTDGGEHWQRLHPDPYGAPGFRRVRFLDPQHGVILSQTTMLHRTSDGGETWEAIRVALRSGLRDMCWLTPQLAYAIGDSLYKTTDGGSQWRAIRPGVLDGWVYFVDSLHGWIPGARTTDAGASWLPDAHGDPVAFQDTLRGWAFGYSGISHTSDGGATWQLDTALACRGGYYFAEHGKLIALGHRENYFEHKESTWQSVFERVSHAILYHGLASPSAGVYIAVGGDDGGGGEVLRSSDGGGNWTTVITGHPHSFRGVNFVDSLAGWVVGYEGTILKSTDGGCTWQLQLSGSEGGLRQVQFFDRFRGIASGGSLVLATTDGGASWTPRALPDYTLDLWGMHFLDSLHGWVSGSSYVNTSRSVILQTTDGGLSWQAQHDALLGNVWSVLFQDSLTGWAGSSASLLKTTDGGHSWLPTGVYSTRGVMRIRLTEDCQLLVSTTLGRVLRSSDGGSSWENLGCPLSLPVTDILLDAQNNLVAISEGPNLCQLKSDEPNNIHEPLKQDFQKHGFTCTSFPNPFNGQTTIEIVLSKGDGPVNLAIHNILGQRILSVGLGNLQAGNHKFTWDGKNGHGFSAPSGLYIVTLRSERFQGVLKISLIR